MSNAEQTIGHYLITRFNVPLRLFRVDKAGAPTRDAAWMRERLLLFGRYCVPTVATQSFTDFTWLLFLDVLTPDPDVAAIRSMASAFARTEIIPVADEYAMVEALQSRLAQDPADMIITTRLDNDDGLGRHYMQVVRQSAGSGDMRLVNILDGLLYNTASHVLTRQRNARRNAFTSLVERNRHDGRLLTVFGFAHHSPPAGIEEVNVKSRYGWIKIIHARNVSSRLKGRPLWRLPADAPYRFDRTYLAINPLNTCAYLLRRGAAILRDRLLR